MAGNTTFLVTTTGGTNGYVVNVQLHAVGSHKQTVLLSPTKKNTVYLVDGTYIVDYVFSGPKNCTIEIAITDDLGNPVRPPIDDSMDNDKTIKPGKSLLMIG